MRRLLLLLVLGGCPPPTQYLITDVTAFRQPVADALVAADCGSDDADAAMRTDVDGRAKLQFRRRIEARTCTVTVAKEGFSTVEADLVSVCTTPACPATHVELGAITPAPAPMLPREYATPPVAE
jgi:hypothetical protein